MLDIATLYSFSWFYNRTVLILGGDVILHDGVNELYETGNSKAM